MRKGRWDKKMEKKQQKLLSAAFLIFILFVGVCFSTSEPSYDQAPPQHAISDSVSGETITVPDASYGANIAGGNYTRTAFSFARMAERQHSIRDLGRSFFNSVFAVLFKTAVIPTFIFAVLFCTGEYPAATRKRIVLYIHNTDGKKGRKSYLPASR